MSVITQRGDLKFVEYPAIYQVGSVRFGLIWFGLSQYYR